MLLSFRTEKIRETAFGGVTAFVAPTTRRVCVWQDATSSVVCQSENQVFTKHTDDCRAQFPGVHNGCITVSVPYSSHKLPPRLIDARA